MDLQRFVFTFFNAEIATEYWPDILKGIAITVQLALAVIACGLVLGLVLAIMRSFQIRALNAFIVVFADSFRALPPLMVIIILFFAFPYARLPMSAFTATWLSLTLVLAAFAEEIFWAGIVSIQRGQWEAARSTGMSTWQALIHVIMPQAIRLTIPPLTNRTIAITKGTALGSVVALPEILGTAHSASSLAGNPTPLTIGALIYLALFVPLVLFGRWIETRYAWKR
jgi:polar amino acid transport system permease protein